MMPDSDFSSIKTRKKIGLYSRISNPRQGAWGVNIVWVMKSVIGRIIHADYIASILKAISAYSKENIERRFSDSHY